MGVVKGQELQEDMLAARFIARSTVATVGHKYSTKV